MKANSKENEKIVAEVIDILKIQNQILKTGLQSITLAIKDLRANENHVAVAVPQINENHEGGFKDECYDEQPKEDEEKMEEKQEYENDDDLESDEYDTEYLDTELLKV